MQNIQDYVRRTASAAKQASYIVAAAETAQKNAALLRTAAVSYTHLTLPTTLRVSITLVAGSGQKKIKPNTKTNTTTQN